MDFERLILEKLITRYENSAHYRETATVDRRVMLKLGPHSRDLKEYDIEQPEQKHAIHEAVLHLNESGLIRYEWERFNKGNVLSIVWLNLESIEKIYERLGRRPKRETVDTIRNVIHKMLDEATVREEDLKNPGLPTVTEPINKSWIISSLQEMKVRIDSTGRLTPLLPDDLSLAGDLLTVLRELMNLEFSEKYVRVFSLQCFQDSKYFEKNMLSRVLMLVRRFHPMMSEAGEADATDEVSDDSLLALIGLFRNPEIYEFCGPVELSFRLNPDKDVFVPESDTTSLHGQTGTLNYGVFRFGSALHSSSIADLKSIDASRIRRLLFIENRTSYHAYIRSERLPGELVVYHGGFQGLTRLRFFCALAAATAPDATIHHWGDIDLGGIQIFLKLRQSIPTLQPWRMDRSTLLAMREKALLFSPAYRKALQKAMDNPAYADFHDLIHAMLETGLRLEQEAFI